MKNSAGQMIWFLEWNDKKTKEKKTTEDIINQGQWSKGHLLASKETLAEEVGPLWMWIVMKAIVV